MCLDLRPQALKTQILIPSKKWKDIDQLRSSKTLQFDECSWLAIKADEAKQEIIPLIKPYNGKQKEVLIINDYRECATGTLAIVAAQYIDNRFRKPGATNSTGWMSQVLYCQKCSCGESKWAILKSSLESCPVLCPSLVENW